MPAIASGHGVVSGGAVFWASCAMAVPAIAANPKSATVILEYCMRFPLMRCALPSLIRPSLLETSKITRSGTCDPKIVAVEGGVRSIWRREPYGCAQCICSVPPRTTLMERRSNPGYTLLHDELPLAHYGDRPPLSRDCGRRPDVDLVRVRHRDDVRGLPAFHRAGASEHAVADSLASVLPRGGRAHPG